MQLLLPIYPQDTKLISNTTGVFEKDDFVYYMANGLPIYCPEKSDVNKFRFITSNLIERGLCTQQEVVRCFHVSEDSVSRYVKKFRKTGERAFFGEEARHGRSHKLLPEVLEKMQAKLMQGKSVNSIAKEFEVTEGALRYAIKTGRLKKN